MRRKVYLETTIASYLTALPTRDLIRAAHQQITTEWWQGRDRFDLFVSEAVLQEAAAGDTEASVRRLTALQGIRVLEATAEVAKLAHRLVTGGAVPAKAAVDAVHIAVAAVNGLDFRLSWNCTHIANAATRGRIEQACRAAEVVPPVICTPEELLEE